MESDLYYVDVFDKDLECWRTVTSTLHIVTAIVTAVGHDKHETVRILPAIDPSRHDAT